MIDDDGHMVPSNHLLVPEKSACLLPSLYQFPWTTSQMVLCNKLSGKLHKDMLCQSSKFLSSSGF